MKIIDEKGRLFGKVNLLDLVIVLVIVLLAVSLVLKFGREEASYLKSDKVLEYTLKVELVREPTVTALAQNHSGLTDYETGKEIGDITDTQISKARELVQLTDGTYKEVEHVDKYDVLLTLRVGGTETADNFYTVSGRKIIVGDEIKIYNGYVSTVGIVKSVCATDE